MVGISGNIFKSDNCVKDTQNQPLTLEFIISQLGEIPFCQCDSNEGKGCGQKINVRTDRRSYNYYKRKGYPRFIKEHQFRGKNNPMYDSKRFGELNPMFDIHICGEKHHNYGKTGELSTFYGKHHTNNTIKNIIKTNKETWNEQEIKEQHSKIMSEIWKRPEVKESCSGKNNHNYGKPPSHDKRFIHNSLLQGEIKFHSWDYLFAKYLDSINKPYLYELFTFELILNNKETTYTPDFYLPETDEFVEVKGYWREDAKEKFETFKLQYPDIKIKLLMKDDLKNLGINLSEIYNKEVFEKCQM